MRPRLICIAVALAACSTFLQPRPAPEAPPGSICSADGWCWTRPLPQGESISGAFAFGEHDVWMVGAGGLALHYDGSVWSRSETGVSEPLAALWGSSPRDLWAVG